MGAKRHIVLLVMSVSLIPPVWAILRAATKAGGETPHPTYAQAKRETLRGLQGVEVLVEGLDPDVEKLGLTREALKADTELQLRQYGIKVLSREEWLTAPGMPYLYIVCNAQLIEGTGLVAYNVQVELSQQVLLVRDPAIECTAVTWRRSSVGSVGRGNLRQVRDGIKDDVAEFINDYLAVNPREPATKKEAEKGKP